MLFSSKEFAIFFVIVCTLYWLAYKWRSIQNLVLLAASMYFYGNLHYSFPIYLMLMVGISFMLGKLISKNEDEARRKRWMILSVCVISLGLFYTKYSGFIFGNIRGLEHWQASALHILVPVGISFYTFAMLGYVLDVYYETIPPESNFITYATYISFFPQLLSGPIPSARTVLPQFSRKPVITFASIDEGIGEFLWGLFKKMVVADNISLAVNLCFSDNNTDMNGCSLYIGGILYVVQVYADFSGYSSMAWGCAKFLGIHLIQNFHMPLFSRSVSEYWRRWHISLTTWFSAYIYSPIVFSLKSWRQWGVILSLFITFFISGFWHGAGWQYIIFGLLNGFALIYEVLTRDIRLMIFGKLPVWLNSLISNIIVFNFMIIAAIFFRSNSVKDAVHMISMICSRTLFQAPTAFILKYLKWCVPLFAVEWIQRKGTYTMDVMQWLPTRVTAKNKRKKYNTVKINMIIKVVLYILLIVSIYLFYKKQNIAEFYYFKF